MLGKCFPTSRASVYGAARSGFDVKERHALVVMSKETTLLILGSLPNPRLRGGCAGAQEEAVQGHSFSQELSVGCCCPFCHTEVSLMVQGCAESDDGRGEKASRPATYPSQPVSSSLLELCVPTDFFVL